MTDIGPALPHEIEPALRLAFARFPPEDARERLRRALDCVATGELPREGILVARGAAGLLGCCVTVTLPGAAAMIWPPAALGADRAAVADTLVRAAMTSLAARGAKVAQTMLPPDEGHLAIPLERNGVRFVTHLHSLRHDLRCTDDIPCEPRLALVPFADAPRTTFVRTLLRSYEESLDFPELDGARDGEEILAGHAAHGLHNRHRWWLALEEGTPVAVLLLSAAPGRGAWELGYLGVVPEARGRGLGRLLTHRAIREAAREGACELTLTVDERNLPARSLYAGLGFEPFDCNAVYLGFPGRGWRAGAAALS